MSIKKKSKELKLPKEKKRAPAQKKRRSRLGKHNMAPFLAPSIIGVTLFFLLPFLHLLPATCLWTGSSTGFLTHM